jgi:DNA-binding transcriptional ArsR family regulator
MARAATTTDAFNAVAEPRRREILDALVAGERSVGELVDRLGVTQPVVSKHLRVLREVGLVRARDDGRQRFYSLDPAPLREVYDWVKDYEQLWSERFELLDTVLEELKSSDRSQEPEHEPEEGRE